MNPAMKGTKEEPSGSGVFYQAIPAVGADGKKIMKLIPVQMINGQFFHIQLNKPKQDSTPQKSVPFNIASEILGQMAKKAALNLPATQQDVRKQVAVINSLSKQGADLRSSLNKCPLQQQAVNLKAKAPLMATPATSCERSVRLASELPVRVNSPALPRGQYLQIPANAQVRTVPASELPSGVKKQIFTSSASSSSASSSCNVVYVSPVTTVNQGATEPSVSAIDSLNLLSKTLTSCGASSKGSKQHLKLVPKVSQRPNSPMKWTVEEEESSTAPNLDTLISTSVTSKILRAVAKRENCPTAPKLQTPKSHSVASEILKAVAESISVSKHRDANTKPASQSGQGKSGQRQDNALLVCNGKVFFVAKKCGLPPNSGDSGSPTTATNSFQCNKTIVPSSKESVESVAPDISQHLRIIIPDESDEVIDLCDEEDDEDVQDGSSHTAKSDNLSTVTHLDEDNVIFVSYIPPKPESGSVKETHQVDTSSSNSVTEHSRDTATEGDGGDATSTLRGRKHDQNTLAGALESLTRVCGSAVVNMHETAGSNINGQQRPSTQQEESMEGHVERGGRADPSIPDTTSGICAQREDTLKMQSSMNPTTSLSLEPKSREMADHRMRQIFGITEDVKICLRRIDEVWAASVPMEPRQSDSVRSVEDHREPTNGSTEKDFFLPHFYSAQENDNENGHTHIGPLKCSHFKLATKYLSALKCNSGQSSLKGTLSDVETESAFGYVEPIDEDFLYTDDIPNSQDTDAQAQTPTCAALNTDTRRMARARKRTVCPCCVSGYQDPAAKFSLKSVEPEQWTCLTEQKSKKGGRAKAVRKDVKTAGRKNCVTAKNKNCYINPVPTSDSLLISSMDPDELKRYEQIERLKELLKEKEAALELMSKS